MNVLSPAKINLMLRILGRREDGYHMLQTYFQLLNWGDDMQFDLLESEDIDIHGDFGDLPTQQNLIYKAAVCLLAYKQNKGGIKISVKKRIPQGAGLGGGSSNAGTTLRILNQLWQCNLTESELIKIAVTLGADVPVFVFNKSAMAYGIGEKLTSYDIGKKHYVLIFPEASISTKEIFQDKDLCRNQSEIKPELVNDRKYWTNTCLPVVLRDYQEVAEIYKTAEKSSPVYMSGTGSTLFVCMDSKTEAEAFCKQCPIHWKTILCQSQ